MANELDVLIAENIYRWDDSSEALRTFSLQNLSAGAGRQGDLFDLDGESSARPLIWHYRWYIEFAASTVDVGDVVRTALKTGGQGTTPGAAPSNDDGATDAAVSAEDKLRNLIKLKPIIVDEAAANVGMVSEGTIWIPQRWIAPVVWNDTDTAFRNTANASFFEIYSVRPVPAT